MILWGRPSHVMLHPTVCVILESNSLIGCIHRYTYDTFTEWHHAKIAFKSYLTTSRTVRSLYDNTRNKREGASRFNTGIVP